MTPGPPMLRRTVVRQLWDPPGHTATEEQHWDLHEARNRGGDFPAGATQQGKTAAVGGPRRPSAGRGGVSGATQRGSGRSRDNVHDWLNWRMTCRWEIYMFPHTCIWGSVSMLNKSLLSGYQQIVECKWCRNQRLFTQKWKYFHVLQIEFWILCALSITIL